MPVARSSRAPFTDNLPVSTSDLTILLCSVTSDMLRRMLLRVAWCVKSGCSTDHSRCVASTAGRMRPTSSSRCGDGRGFAGFFECFTVASTAPQDVCPKTRIVEHPKLDTANSMLASKLGATTLPATRTTKRSPTPWSNMSSAGLLESEQVSTTANGRWPLAARSAIRV